MTEFKFKPPGDTLKQFMLSDDFFRGLRGPVGSAKSSTCCVEIFRRALQQKSHRGRKQFRCAVVRNTYAELRTTTLQTWLQWFPESDWGPVMMHPPPFLHRLQKGELDLEVMFLALDKPDDVKKLLSLELTMVWLNEARELPKSIVDAATMRVGRYPSMKDGGPSWSGVIADTNAPDDDHWWPIMAGEAPIPDHVPLEEARQLVKPSGWSFYTQPGGMRKVVDHDKNLLGYEINPAAENIKNLTPGYYDRIIAGKSSDWIKVYVLNELASLTDGKPVYPDWTPDLHLAKEELQPVPGIPLTIGVDFGLTPSATIGQKLRNRWLVLGELVAQDMGAVRFAEVLRGELAQRWPGFSHVIWGDPAGDYRAQTDEQTPFQILRRAGFTARPAPTNDPALRIDAVTGCLTRLLEKEPGLLLDPRCVNLRKGFDGGYHYKRLAVSGAERFDMSPNKNKFSHVHDALQYMLCGGGESRKILGGGDQKPVVARVDYDVFARKPKPGRLRHRGV